MQLHRVSAFNSHMKCCYVSALTVRFLTRRYIGEYDHQSGEKNPEARCEALIEKFRNCICHSESDAGTRTARTVFSSKYTSFHSLYISCLYIRIAPRATRKQTFSSSSFGKRTFVSSSERKIPFLAENSALRRVRSAKRTRIRIL